MLCKPKCLCSLLLVTRNAMQYDAIGGQLDAGEDNKGVQCETKGCALTTQRQR